MKIAMNRNSRGFTLIEIVVVMVLISIIAAATFSRSITTDQINFVGQVDKILNQIRYTKSLAMKRSQGDNTERWGFRCTGNIYFLFHRINEVNSAPFRFPGEENDLITLSDLGVDMDSFILYFDNLGRPYSGTTTNNLTVNLEIAISSEVDPTLERTIIITPETGFIKIQ